MRVVARFRLADLTGEERTVIQQVQPGTWNTVMLTVPYLVSKDQQVVMSFGAEVVTGPEDAPRSLVDILAEAVQHGKDNPDHGGNCACLDRLVREIKQQINAVLPTSEDEPDWERRTDARWRVTYLLNAASRYI